MESYTATRIRVMRTKLIDSQQYEHLMRMSDKEVLSFLQSTAYRKEVDSLSIRDIDDLEAVDRIIAANAKRIYTKLDRISRKQFKDVLSTFLENNDAWNITVIAEAITGENDPKEAVERYGKHGTFDPHEYTDAKSVKDLATRASRHVPALKNVGTFKELIHALSKSSTMRKHTTEPYLLDEKNIITLLQFKRENVAPDEIAQHFLRGGTLGYDFLRDAARQDVNGIFQLLNKTKYKEVTADVDPNNLALFESKLHRFIVKKIRSKSRQRPFGTSVMINYIAEKEIEHGNLRVLIKGKRLGLDETFIKEHMIV